MGVPRRAICLHKLKKPLRFHDFDLTTLATRRVDCELEVASNRRLAPAVYVGTIPATALTKRIAAVAGPLHARAADGRVVDAHGDLRPEHIFLTPEPQIIDCLEFSAELRLLDSGAEIAFLALECERLGHAELRQRLLALYRQYAQDDIDGDLFGLYRDLRAFVRAKLAAWHLHDQLDPAAATHWHERTLWYLDVAASGTERVRPSICR